MSIEKRSDLFREYARVIDMCEGTEIDPWVCVRVKGFGSFDKQPDFGADRYRYDFAVAILEGKPVFVGDEIYHPQLGKTIVSEEAFQTFIGNYTWNKPTKRTFTLAGGVLPMPINNEQTAPRMHVGGELYYFNTHAERNDFELVINKIIKQAMQK